MKKEATGRGEGQREGEGNQGIVVDGGVVGGGGRVPLPSSYSQRDLVLTALLSPGSLVIFHRVQMKATRTLGIRNLSAGLGGSLEPASGEGE